MIGRYAVRCISLAIGCLFFRTALAALDEQLLIIGEWKEAYSEIFGEKSDEGLTESQVQERVMFLQEEPESEPEPEPEPESEEDISDEEEDTPIFQYGRILRIKQALLLGGLRVYLKAARNAIACRQWTLRANKV